MKITLQQLIDKRACANQVKLFKRHFGQSVTVTEARAVKVAALFNWDWAAYNLLSAPARADYEKAIASAWADYHKATAPARADYAKARDSAWADYHKATAPARADYEKAIAPARADYAKARDSAWADYAKARARAFARAANRKGKL